MEAKVAQFSEAVAAARGGDADAAVRAVLSDPAEPTDVAALPLEEVFVKWTERTPPLEATSYAVSQPLGSAGVRLHRFELRCAEDLNAAVAIAADAAAPGLEVSNVGGVHTMPDLFEMPACAAWAEFLAASLYACVRAASGDADLPASWRPL